MIESGLIESIINKRDNFNKETISLVKQYMILNVLSKINDGNFRDFGNVLCYKFKSELLNEDVRFDIKSNYFNMEFEYVVLKKEDDIYILDVDSNTDDDYFGIKTSGTIAYIYKNILYIDGYIKDSLFENELKRINFKLANIVQYSFDKDLYKGIVSFYDMIKEKSSFKNKVNDCILKNDLPILNKSKASVIRDFINFFAKDNLSFTLKDIDMEIYFNVFKGENKDKILNLLLGEMQCSDYRKCTRNIYEYTIRGDEYINSFIDKHANSVTNILINKHSCCLFERNLIEKSLDVIERYENLCIYNREVVYLYELMKDAIDKIGCKKVNISFDGENFIDISSAIKYDKSCVDIDGIVFSSIDIFTNVWSQKSNIVAFVSLKNLKNFTLRYKGVDIFKIDAVMLKRLKCLRDKICYKEL